MLADALVDHIAEAIHRTRSHRARICVNGYRELISNALARGIENVQLPHDWRAALRRRIRTPRALSD